MPLAGSAFLDALGAFALVVLIGLVIAAVIALVLDRVGKTRGIKDAVRGLDQFGKASDAIDSQAAVLRETTNAPEGQELEVFLLAARTAIGDITPDQALRAQGKLAAEGRLTSFYALWSPEEEGFPRTFPRPPLTEEQLRGLGEDLDFLDYSRSALVALGSARQLLGRTPVAALEYVLTKDREGLRRHSWLRRKITARKRIRPPKQQPYAVGQATHIVNYLQRCDAVDAAISANTSRSKR